ncbi:hypothetical protein ACFO0U_00845 [Chromohalobacter sarecensis]|uniref:Uncharacterized protein n=1 Tax=Chromohalobacter sarecensis TaxID=245294 RepID=A0ABV9CVL5_9GAMM|nr:hypothetical protein [Chromohalobacter sarecensis]MCK0715648.1 hypothetical protein [Chromohalobacter sarecensis]
MEASTIISGLIGALISAALSYIVRIKLENRSKGIEQKKQAYVYLVSVSEIIATNVVVKSFITTLIDDETKRKLSTAEKDFEASHAICALLANHLKDVSDENISELGLKNAPKYFTPLIESTKESKLTPEQLSKLPKNTVYTCHQFQKSLGHILQITAMWTSYIEDGDRFWVTPEGLHDHWTTITRFLNQAEATRISLVKYGAATPGEAEKLLEKQVKEIHETIWARFQNSSPLAAAAESLQSEMTKN